MMIGGAVLAGEGVVAGAAVSGIDVGELLLDHVLLRLPSSSRSSSLLEPGDLRWVSLFPLQLFRHQLLGGRLDLVENRLFRGVVGGAERLGPLEEHVLQQVGKPALVASLVHAPHLEADPGGDGRRGVARHHQELHAVFQGIFLHLVRQLEPEAGGGRGALTS